MDSLFMRLANGEAVRDELIVSLIPLAKQRVSARISRTPSLEGKRDDLEGDAMVALVQAVDGLLGSNIENPEAYVQTAIDRGISDSVLDYDDGPSVRTKQRQIAADTYEPLTFESLSDQIPNREDKSAELLSDIYDACLDSTDRKIVELLRQSYSTREVAEQLDLTPATVRNRRKSIETRFEAIAL